MQAQHHYLFPLEFMKLRNTSTLKQVSKFLIKRKGFFKKLNNKIKKWGKAAARIRVILKLGAHYIPKVTPLTRAVKRTYLLATRF